MKLGRIAKWLTLLGIMAFVVTIGVAHVHASELTEQEETEYSLNNILFYRNCVPRNSGRTLSGEISISGATAEEKIWSGLTSFLTDEQAAGVIGNIGQEDGNYNPVRREVGQSGGLYNRGVQMGVGFVQWSFGRRVDLLNYIKEQDPSLIKYFEDSSLAQISGDEFIKKVGEDDANKIFQLEIQFIKYEIDKGYKEYYKKTDIDDATVWFRENYEKAGVYSDTYRKQKAHAAYDKYAGKTITGSSGSVGSGTADACNAKADGSNNINGAAVALAWPLGTDKKVFTYTQSNGLQSKKAYKNISKWTGGKATDAFNSAFDGVYPEHNKWSQCPSIGASCDVFVGTAIRYSGYDKEWPRGLGGQLKHAKANPDLWEIIDNAKGTDPKAGDVVNTGGHTYIVVQDENGEYYRAEAGLCHNFGRISGKFKGFESGATVFRAKSANNSTSGISVTDGVRTSSKTGKISDKTTGNYDIGASALYFAWPYKEFTNAMKPESKDAWYKMAEENGVKVKGHVTEGASCVVFVWGTLRYSGLISNFKISERLDEQLEKEPDWQKVAEGNVKEDELEDGDVLIWRCNRHGSSNYPCHYGIYVERDGQGYTVEASNPSGCGDSGGCNYQYPHVSKKGIANYWSEAWRNSSNKQGGGVCDVCGGDGDGGDFEAGELKAGGMSLAEAEEWIKAYHDAAMGKYYKKRGSISFLGADIYDAGCPFGVMNNCVALSQWFVNKYTTIGPNWNNTTNGVNLASKLVNSAGLTGGNKPRPYAIFSNGEWSSAGHTGVVLGVDTNAKKVVIAEASCSSSGSLSYPPHVVEYTFDRVKKWNYAYTDNVLKGGLGGDV